MMSEHWGLTSFSFIMLMAFIWLTSVIKKKQRVKMIIQRNPLFIQSSLTKDNVDLTRLGYSVMQEGDFQRLKFKSTKSHKAVENELQYLLGNPKQKAQIIAQKVLQFVGALLLGITTVILCSGLLIEITDSGENENPTTIQK